MKETPTELGRPAVLAQSSSWLVIDKPAGWLSRAPSAPGSQPVVLDWARREVEGPVLPVHRLDVETSGVILFARTADAHRQANEWFAKHQVRKIYHLLAQGEAPGEPTVRINAEVGGKPAATLLEVRERFGGQGFYAHARPLTGRRHQIRLHLSGIGHPLHGDPAYGGDFRLATRVALHAAELALPSGEVFKSSWPPDFAAWVEKLRGAQS
jgi:23S rRNA-/tRNA-specific pseudouridylate synthase